MSSTGGPALCYNALAKEIKNLRKFLSPKSDVERMKDRYSSLFKYITTICAGFRYMFWAACRPRAPVSGIYAKRPTGKLYKI